MYLKRLESRGFKSFAERINVDFVEGVTAVVGPNGSGKSNITDAIRWVLGEQSARSLRGSKMEDVIFQGSDTRSALNVAEVVLVLDNKSKRLPIEYEEVSITRRVFRSGVSEFYINNQACRLKDIIDLFMDSGLGSEAFSIISQGRVEEILSSKAEERRVIFEEAAGVLKYKQRKKKAEYKLIETEENMNRVNDIVHEIEQQIDPLYKQAETAKIYLEKKNKLKEKEIATTITQIDDLHVEWQNLLADIEKDREEKLSMDEKREQLARELDDERKQLNQTDQMIESLQEELLQATKQLEKDEGEKNVHLERTTHVNENKTKLEARKEKLTKQVTELKHLSEEQEKKTLIVQNEVTDLRGSVEELETKLNKGTVQLSKQIEDLKADYIEMLNEQAANRNEKQAIAEQLNQLVHTKDNQSSKKASVFNQKATLEKEVTEASEKEQEAKLELESVTNNFTEKKDEKDRLSLELQNDREKLSLGQQKIAKFRSRKEILQEMKDEFQGFYHGVKAILQARENEELKQIHGAVIELIDVPKTYITAIETVLGGQSQFVVVEDDYAARQAIDWLKVNRKGRATLLPIRSIQERFIQGSVLNEVKKHPGFIGVAADLVTTDSTYEKVVRHLMGHVIVAKTLKDANEIAKQTGRRNRIVTLEGDLVNPGGTMSGGSKKQTNQSLFTRDDELKELTQKLNKMENRTAQFVDEIEQKQAHVSQLETQLLQLETNVTEKQELVWSLESKRRNAEMELDSLLRQVSSYEEDERQFTENKARLEQREQEVEENLLKIKEDITQTEEKVAELTKEENDLRASAEQDREQLQKLQVQLAEREERLKHHRSAEKELIQEKEELEIELAEIEQDLEQILTSFANAKSMEELDEQIKKSQNDIDALTETISNDRKQRVDLTQKIEDLQRELTEHDKLLSQLVQKIQEKEVKANRLDVSLQNLLHYLQEEYTISFERAKQLYEKVAHIEDAKLEVKSLKSEITSLGDVNVGAIEEYDRLSERYEFLQQQQSDLTEAKNDLFAIIEEMDSVMKEQFGETFKQIKEQFSKVFTELFGGGNAELRLTEPKDLLETGIEIIAQPPGKKLQQLGLLSGGERALTAIALLFSILRVRPVPFCVLDEVEAALDEANVVRFAKYVKMHSVETQFIVITHRKGTMEEADVLYGVTMEESGVSRLVSVQLEDSRQLLESRE